MYALLSTTIPYTSNLVVYHVLDWVWVPFWAIRLVSYYYFARCPKTIFEATSAFYIIWTACWKCLICLFLSIPTVIYALPLFSTFEVDEMSLFSANEYAVLLCWAFFGDKKPFLEVNFSLNFSVSDLVALLLYTLLFVW